MPARQEERRREQPDDEERECEAPGGRPRPRELRLDPHPERAGNGVDPGLVRQLRERQDERQRQRGDRADRGRDAGPRKAGGEPPHEGHEPQRHEVEPVAVVEPVVAPRRAREGGDDEQPRDVGRGEQADERGRPARARPSRRVRAPRARSGHGDRHDHEVDGEVAEVVDEPLGDRERVVAAPELPVRAERVLGRASGGEPCDERERAEHDRQRGGPEPHELGARPRPRRGCEQPETCKRADPGDVEDPELRPCEHRGGDRPEDGELAEDARSLERERDRVQRPHGGQVREALGHHGRPPRSTRESRRPGPPRPPPTTARRVGGRGGTRVSPSARRRARSPP